MYEHDIELRQHLIERILFVGVFNLQEGEKQIAESIGLVYYSETKVISMINEQPEIINRSSCGQIVDIKV